MGNQTSAIAQTWTRSPNCPIGLLWHTGNPGDPFPRLILFNVLDGKRWEISTTNKEAREFVVGLVRARRTATELTDDAFRGQYEKTLKEARAIVDRIPQPMET